MEPMRSPGETDYGFIAVVNGRKMLFVSSEEAAEYAEDNIE